MSSVGLLVKIVRVIILQLSVMKKLAILILVVVSMVSCMFLPERGVRSVDMQVEGDLFSNAPVGFLSIYESPSEWSFKIGELKNGPKGATMVEYGARWSKVSYNNIEGYVKTQYLQTEPTKPVNINFAVLLGVWCLKAEDGELSRWVDLLIFDNGTYAEFAIGFCEGAVSSVGTWVVEDNNLILTEHYDLVSNLGWGGWGKGVKSNKKRIYKVNDESRVLVAEDSSQNLYKLELLTDAEVARDECEGYTPRWSQKQLDGMRDYVTRDYIE